MITSCSPRAHSSSLVMLPIYPAPPVTRIMGLLPFLLLDCLQETDRLKPELHAFFYGLEFRLEAVQSNRLKTELHVNLSCDWFRHDFYLTKRRAPGRRAGEEIGV